MILSITYIALGLLVMVWSADRLILGASATARNLGVSPLIIGLTIIGFGTSAPEMVVSAIASWNGSPGLALGNAVGSNIANIGLILGLTAVIYPLKINSHTLKREYPILLLVSLGTLGLLLDGHLDRMDGVILIISLVIITVWIGSLGLRKEADPLADEYDAEIPTDMSMGKASMWVLVGLVLLPTSSHFLVLGASNIASMLGVSDVMIGLTIVALGTSLPELAAALTSAIRKEHDIAIGNILGSNMFNLMGVLGIAGLVMPIQPEPELLYRDYSLMLVLTLLLFGLSYGFRKKAVISRWAGLVLLGIYLSYQTYLILTISQQGA